LNKGAFDDARVITLTAGGIVSEGVTPVFMDTDKINAETGLAVTEKIANIQIMNIDADLFLSNVRGSWDVIFIDLPDPSSVELSKLYTKGFYMKVRRVLSEHGVMVVQSTSPYYAKKSYLCIGETLRAAGFNAIPYHENVPSFGEWGWWMSFKDSVSDKVIMGLIKDLKIEVPTKFLTEDVFRRELVFGKGELEGDVEVNTLMYHVLLEYYLNEDWLAD